MCALALAITACACDGGAGDDARSSTVIVATTVPAAPTPSPQPTSGTAAPTSDPPASEPSAHAPASSPPVGEPSASEPASSPPSSAPAPTVGDPRVAVSEVGSFERPVDLVARPEDAALYVVQQTGQVVRWPRGGDAGEDPRPVLDLADRVSGASEQGLLGLAFSPDGTTAYVDYTAVDGTTTIAEYQVAADGTFDVASERIVITVAQPYRNHNAGDLHVDDAGLLYVTLGDGGSGGDPERVAHDPTSLLGSLLRIDPTPSGDRPYTIPPDNPFADGPLTLADGTTIDGAPEVFAWGLRNPWKLAFDQVTGELWIPDVGQNAVEEVNVVGPVGERPAGWAHDFGWSAFEGTDRFNEDVPDSGRTTPPVLTYRHGDDGCSVTGGAPYRGTAIPDLAPAFVYSDYCSGILWALDLAGARNLVLLEGLAGVTAIRADAAGELYVLEADGTISQLVPG